MLLFVHGGPGSSELPLLANDAALKERFVVVHWEQRGTGKSYDLAVFNKSFTLGTFVEDAAELSRLLAERFNQPGIYLMGHSWGTFLGFKQCRNTPNCFMLTWLWPLVVTTNLNQTTLRLDVPTYVFQGVHDQMPKHILTG